MSGCAMLRSCILPCACTPRGCRAHTAGVPCRPRAFNPSLSTLMFIDTHTHIYTEEFDADRTEVVQRAVLAGARALLLPNIDEGSLPAMLKLANAYPALCYPMLGLHPTELPPDPQPLLNRMEQLLTDPHHPYVAVGEVGIDLYWDDSRREEQLQVFARQAEWAVRFGLPLVVHMRAAQPEVVSTLQPLADRLTGVFHCFGGTLSEAEELLHTFPGFYLGIGGILTFKKSTLPAVLHAAVPLERIVIETDAPYLAPTPYRGSRNEPAYLPLVIHKLAEIYECSPEHVSQQLLTNTLHCFPRVKG